MHSDHSGPEIRKEQLSRLKQVRNHHQFITIIQQFRKKKTPAWNEIALDPTRRFRQLRSEIHNFSTSVLHTRCNSLDADDHRISQLIGNFSLAMPQSAEHFSLNGLDSPKEHHGRTKNKRKGGYLIYFKMKILLQYIPENQRKQPIGLGLYIHSLTLCTHLNLFGWFRMRTKVRTVLQENHTYAAKQTLKWREWHPRRVGAYQWQSSNSAR